MGFINLHAHDEFSLSDGIGKVEDMVKLYKGRGEKYCCVTNHGSIGGWIKQYVACKKAGLKPIFGCEMYVNNNREELDRENRHLIVLAKNKQGFQNIIKLHNEAQINGFYYRPRTCSDVLMEHGAGIIGLSACAQGEIAKYLATDRVDKAKSVYGKYSFGFDDFFIELSMIESDEQIELNNKLIMFAKEMGAKLVVTLDSHYLLKEYEDTHNILLLMKSKKTVDDIASDPDKTWQFDVKGLYCRSEEELRELFVRRFKNDIFTQEVFDDAVRNTEMIAESVENFVLDSSPKLPKVFDEPDKALEEHSFAGLKERCLVGQVYEDRLKRELGVIIKMGFSDYFLIVERIISEVRQEFGEWSVGYGRGSVGGSLVAYCLKITDVDPIKYGLLFERFLDEGRAGSVGDYPDIDMDFSPEARDWARERITKQFGEDHVSVIGLYLTYKTRVVILDVSRALGIDVSESMEVTKKIDALAKFSIEDEEGNEEEQVVDKMDFNELVGVYPDLGKFFERYPEVKKHASVLRNQVKSMGSHAGGMIISNVNLRDFIPVVRSSDETKYVSGWVEGLAVHELSEVGLVKFDLLGVNNLNVIRDCVNLVKETRGIELKRKDVPIDDQEVVKMGSNGDLMGIFQFENPSLKPYVDKVGMMSLMDISIVTALLRPGPKNVGLHDEYVRRRRSGEYKKFGFLGDILDGTEGVLCFQEDIMRLAQKLSNFTPGESNKLRKACGKKNPELMLSMRNKFVEGAKQKIDEGLITQEEVETMWDQIESFGGYGFCRAHAFAYSAITAVEIWLKLFYPLEFIVSLMNNTKLGKEKYWYSMPLMVEYLLYARRRVERFKILLPDVNKSKGKFTIEDGAIRFSLAQIKGIGESTKSIVDMAPYSSFEDFYERQNRRVINKRVVEALIYVGAFDQFGTRNEIMKKYLSMKKSKKELGAFEELTQEELYSKESEILGMVLSREPVYYVYGDRVTKKKGKFIEEVIVAFNEKKERDKELTKVKEGEEEEEKLRTLQVFGRIDKIDSRISKKKQTFYIVSLSDDVGLLTFFVFEKAIVRFDKLYKVGTIGLIPLSQFGDGGLLYNHGRNGNIFVQSD